MRPAKFSNLLISNFN